MTNDARTYQAFYTKSTPIVDYMVNHLLLSPSDKILEPCGGDGAFVEALLNVNKLANIDICELSPASVAVLQSKFSTFQNVRIRECDTLLDNDLSFKSSFGGIYDKIIANPPYGAWQDLAKRAVLKKMYSDLYAKESYALFLFRCIELLTEGGILSFIIPDTFLNLHMHKAIRKHILTKTKIVELALFPSSFFPGVNFGYANLSIITLQKSSHQQECLSNCFHVLTGFSRVDQLAAINKEDLKVYSFSQQEIFSNPDHAFLIADNASILSAINNTQLKVGDMADCVTGFYSGDDKTFLQVNSFDLKNGRNYELVDPDKINLEYKNAANILEGLGGKKHFLPILKGGNIKYLKPEAWFMNWSKEAVSHYKKDKKARFQNPQYYFKFGIGVPMISSSSITASLIENKLFDQSIVGVFPKDENLTYYLLAFFNSPTCNKLIRTINPSANNPANYIKKIPFIAPTDEQKDFIDSTVKSILTSISTKGYYDETTENTLHEVIQQIYGF